MNYNKLILFFICTVLCQTVVRAQQNPKNPLDIPLGDPFVLFDESSATYYLYGTGGTENGFVAYSSNDLNSWKKHGVVYTAKQPKSWGTKDFWAPEVYHFKGKYYLFYSAHWKENPSNELENYRIGVAVSNSPVGPFEDLTGAPLFDPGYPIIDANVYFADDGKLFLYYSRCCYEHPVSSQIADWAKEKGFFKEIEESWIYGVELAADFSGVLGEPKLLLRPPTSLTDSQSEWESRSVTSREVNRRWTEGSFLFKQNGLYYMMYSANHFAGENYAVGYATSGSPLGPFKKSPSNPVLEKNTDNGGVVSGTGHNMVLRSADGQLWCVYHGRTTKTGDQRLVFIDRMSVQKDGKLVVHGPSVQREGSTK
ncbi:glycoside hydrolase family 43 protein [Sphingobacterium suaedae]|uniref:Glycoside hydrolase family 43 protein n=1 Tax=Sphingobacterium suaedae TaxID=1686402 RepID=A0ABW5KM38_9SPHI